MPTSSFINCGSILRRIACTPVVVKSTRQTGSFDACCKNCKFPSLSATFGGSSTTATACDANSILVRCQRSYALARSKTANGHPQCSLDKKFLTVTSSVRWCGHDHITHQDCWQCGRSIEPDMEQYFCACGVVQPPLKSRSYFQIFGMEESFNVDLKRLSDKYLKLQFILHPDKYSQKSETEQLFSNQHSTLVSEAYKTLRNPLLRGLYLLRIKGDDLEKEVQMDADFLTEIFELNESLLEADSQEELKKIKVENDSNMESMLKKISEAFQVGDVATTKSDLLKLKYLMNVDDKLHEMVSEEEEQKAN